MTDNRTRTVAELRSLLNKHGGNMGAAGSVAWMFSKKGLITVERAGIDEDRVMEVALEAGAEDVSESGDTLEILTPPDAFVSVKEALDRAGIPTATAEITMMPSTTTPISGETAAKMIRLLEVLEDHDDVQRVSSNMDMAAEEMEKLSA
jgi:YebC/PmpR family DNA-binding regulatory protein